MNFTLSKMLDLDQKVLKLDKKINPLEVFNHVSYNNIH